MGWEWISQQVVVPSSYSGLVDVFFYLDIQGANRTSSDLLTVTVRDAATGNVLERVAQIPATSSAYDCAMFSTTLSNNYSGRTVRLHFQSRILSGAATRFVIDDVNFWAYC